KPNLWILDSWRDLILYVCTPLVIVPIFLVAQARWSAEDIYLFVAAFGAMGHHLPGMIRAYGDRALFQRFKWRFIFAPIFLVVLQQHRGQRSRRHCLVRSISRRPVPLAGLDL